jgi:hypothetical protein
MTDDEINAVVSEFLHKRFDDIGFERSAVRSEDDYDGASILRVTAHFNNDNVPSGPLIDAMHDIRSELIRRGEERFVFLSAAVPEDDVVDEDLE